jgi:RHS repeat-associated protein
VLEEQRTYQGPTLTSIKDARGNITYFNSDGIQRVTKQTYPDGTYETWTYDNNSNVTSHRSRAGIATTQVFDTADRLTSKKVGTEPTQTFTSDNVGRLLTASTPIVAGDPSSGTFSRAYDSAGRLISETNPQGEVIGYELDRNGNVTKVTHPDGYYVQYAYDALNRVTSIKLNGSATDAVAFTYDTLSRRTSKTYANGNTIAYGFDIADRLTSRSLTHAGGTATWGYGHNDVNQITSQTISDAAFEWTPAATSSVSYGTPNNLNQYPTVGGATQSHTTDGQLLSDAVWTYQYDGEGMLIAANKTGVAASFKYDPFSRLIERTVNTNKTRYVYAGSRLLEEYDSVTNALLKRYVYAGTDEAVIEIDGAGNVTYLHQDHQNSLIARANGAGTLTAKYEYSPWGEASLPGTGFGYTGQRWDADLGLYNYKARYYDPAKGRFLQPDPVGYKQDMNLYTYCVNDPVNLSDPTGEEPNWQNFAKMIRDSKILSNPDTFKSGVEYHGVLYKNGDNTGMKKAILVGTNPSTNSQSYLSPIGGDLVVAPFHGGVDSIVHTHPVSSGVGALKTDPKLYSAEDVANANALNASSVIITSDMEVMFKQGSNEKVQDPQKVPGKDRFPDKIVGMFSPDQKFHLAVFKGSKVVAYQAKGF